MANQGKLWVVFQVDERRLALPLSMVERVERSAMPVPLPGAPPGVEGLLNLHGRILPVAAARHGLGHAPKPLALDDLMLVIATEQPYVLVVDNVEGVVEAPGDALPDDDSGDNGGIEGVLAEDSAADVVLRCSPDLFLPPDCRARLAHQLATRRCPA